MAYVLVFNEPSSVLTVKMFKNAHFLNVLSATRMLYGRLNCDLVRLLKLGVNQLQQYFTPPQPLSRQLQLLWSMGKGKTTLKPGVSQACMSYTQKSFLFIFKIVWSNMRSPGSPTRVTCLV